MKLVDSGVPSPRNTRTFGPPPGPAPVMISARPSPSTSPAATNTPPRNPGSYAMKPATRRPPLRKTRTFGPPPGPPPVMISARPSPSTSPAAPGDVLGHSLSIPAPRRVRFPTEAPATEGYPLPLDAGHQIPVAPERPHVRPAARSRSRDDLGPSVPIEIRDRGKHAAAEG